jgi:hypothetical protein
MGGGEECAQVFFKNCKDGKTIMDSCFPCPFTSKGETRDNWETLIIGRTPAGELDGSLTGAGLEYATTGNSTTETPS